MEAIAAERTADADRCRQESNEHFAHLAEGTGARGAEQTGADCTGEHKRYRRPPGMRNTGARQNTSETAGQQVSRHPAEQLMRNILVPIEPPQVEQLRAERSVHVEGLTRNADLATEFFA